VWSLKLIYGRNFGERVNIVMYDCEISLLARFSKMTARVRIFSYCKESLEDGQEQCPPGELFLVRTRGKAGVSWSWGRCRILAPTPSDAKMGPRSTGCIGAEQTRLVRNWFSMWNSHVVEALQGLTLFGTSVFSH
jgi:hypothetical protein